MPNDWLILCLPSKHHFLLLTLLTWRTGLSLRLSFSLFPLTATSSLSVVCPLSRSPFIPHSGYLSLISHILYLMFLTQRSTLPFVSLCLPVSHHHSIHLKNECIKHGSPICLRCCAFSLSLAEIMEELGGLSTKLVSFSLVYLSQFMWPLLHFPCVFFTTQYMTM